MIVTIHQPEHLPWLGFFDKARRADCFVLLDHVQFRKNYFQNRNRIRAAEGAIWLTVPVRLKGRFGQSINQVEIDSSGNLRWREKYWNTIAQCYRKAPFFDHHEPFLKALSQENWGRLADLNEKIIRYFLSALGIQVPILKSSDLSLEESKGDLILEIVQKVGADTYLSGVSGREYLDVEKFRQHGITLKFQEFYHPIYQQLYDPFIPCMSAADLLFNFGPQAKQILQDATTPRLDYLIA